MKWEKKNNDVFNFIYTIKKGIYRKILKLKHEGSIYFWFFFFINIFIYAYKTSRDMQNENNLEQMLHYIYFF